MKTKGGIAVQVLVFLIIVVLTSALIFSLVKFNVISVNQDSSSSEILNTEFLPYAKEGSLVIKDFKFCDSVDESYTCYDEKSDFNFDEEVHFAFVVESSTDNGEIILWENYRIISPSEKVLLDVDQKKSYTFKLESSKEKEFVAFKDYFTILTGQEPGEYTLELVIENPLLDKKTTFSETFWVDEYYDEEEYFEDEHEE